jgi:hypothetical protein
LAEAIEAQKKATQNITGDLLDLAKRAVELFERQPAN